MKHPVSDRLGELQAAGLESITLKCLHKVSTVSPSHQRLSLLELVLEEESVSMVLRRISPVTGSSGFLGDSVVVLIQG